MYVKRQRGVKVGWVRQLFFCLIFLISDACLSVLDSGWKTRSHAGFHYTIARFMKILHEYNKICVVIVGKIMWYTCILMV